MDDLISRTWLLAEYDKRHKGPSGGARKLIEEAPSAQPYTIHSDGRLWITVDDIDKVTAVVVDEHKSKFCKQFYEDYEDAQPEPHWIPVTERLPQAGESVMICDAYGDICIGHRTSSGYYFPDFCEDKIKDVRAWCELPEPYKEVTE